MMSSSVLINTVLIKEKVAFLHSCCDTKKVSESCTYHSGFCIKYNRYSNEEVHNKLREKFQRRASFAVPCHAAKREQIRERKYTSSEASRHQKGIITSTPDSYIKPHSDTALFILNHMHVNGPLRVSLSLSPTRRPRIRKFQYFQK